MSASDTDPDHDVSEILDRMVDLSQRTVEKYAAFAKRWWGHHHAADRSAGDPTGTDPSGTEQSGTEQSASDCPSTDWSGADCLQDVTMAWAESAGDLVQAWYGWIQLWDCFSGCDHHGGQHGGQHGGHHAGQHAGQHGGQSGQQPGQQPGHQHGTTDRRVPVTTRVQVPSPGPGGGLSATAFLDGHGHAVDPKHVTVATQAVPNSTGVPQTEVSLTVSAPPGTPLGAYAGSIVDEDANVVANRVQIQVI